MKELHREIKELNRVKKREVKEKVLKDETHVEVDEIWHKRRFVYFAIGRKTKIILNYHMIGIIGM